MLVNAWDKEEEQNKWPFLEDEFDFVFNEADVATLQKIDQPTLHKPVC